VRLQVSSGAHPRYSRNPGSGEPLGSATTFKIADQHVYHDPGHRSVLILPVHTV
jgi:predicted acyl esterase